MALAWRYGNAAERAMISAFAAGCIVILLTIAIEAVLFWRVWPPALVRQTGLAFFTAGASWPAFSPAAYESMFSPSCYRATLDRDDMTEAEKEFVREYARFKETVGTNGQLPGALGVGSLYLVTYFGAFVGAFVYAAYAYPALGEWTALPYAIFVITLALICWLFYRNRERELVRLAESEGFRLAELRDKLRVNRKVGWPR